VTCAAVAYDERVLSAGAGDDCSVLQRDAVDKRAAVVAVAAVEVEHAVGVQQLEPVRRSASSSMHEYAQAASRHSDAAHVIHFPLVVRVHLPLLLLQPIPPPLLILFNNGALTRQHSGAAAHLPPVHIKALAA